jgi:signal recognition particle subunit SRP54
MPRVMFDALTDRLEGALGRLRGRGKLSAAQVEMALREVRIALLEGDVHTEVVRTFLERVRLRAVGDEVRRALSPAQTVLKIVHDELVVILGTEHVPLRFAPKPPTVIMLAGLKGSGKTTAAAKLARMLRARGKRPLLVAADLRRPAAVEQLVLLGAEAEVPVLRGAQTPVAAAAAGLEEARRLSRDVVIVDTAGRLGVDEEMMAEAAAIRAAISPTETLFVVDAMTGQDAVNVAKAFLQRVDYTGIVLTKLDGDARGGAALSIAHVSGRPVKLASTGERLDSFEPFHPDRMASRILGMGDVLTLIEKTEEVYAAQEQREIAQKMRRATFGLDDFLDQLRALRKMGPVQSLLGLIPGMRGQLRDVEVDEADIRRIEAIIQSMTGGERRDPGVIDSSRRRRIARGCGRTVGDVNSLLRRFEQAKTMMRAMAGGGGLPSLPHATTAAAGALGRPKPKRPHRPKQHGKHKKRKRK